MAQKLSTGGVADPFLPRLLAAIRRADQVDLPVAFVKSSGLDLIFDPLLDMIEDRGGRLRVLTSDYLQLTDPPALRKQMLLTERGADVRVFEAGEQSLHLKAYICVRTSNGYEVWGAAFIDSSNISRTALSDGLEWNYQGEMNGGGAASPEVPGAKDFREVRAAFQSLFDHPRVRRLDYAWLDAYEERRKVQRLPVAPDSDETEQRAPAPTAVQQEALAALAASRKAGYQRGLVVMATGLGKTYLAAFDTDRTKARRVLFVAHREEILLQAEATFQRIHPRPRAGRYTGQSKDTEVDLLFASVQTLGQTHHLLTFEPDQFDYIVVDEFDPAADRAGRI